MSSRLDDLSPWFRHRFSISGSRLVWRERISLSLLGLAALTLIWFGNLIPISVQVAAWCAWFVVLGVLLRQGWVVLFGPVFFFDLLCVSRRRRYFLLRFVYSLLLFLMVFWVHAVWSMTDSQGNMVRYMARFAETFFSTFMSVQFLMVVALTPAYVAGSIAEEKDRKTLEFVLATDLSDREIVLSKLGSRLANLMLLLAVGLPILSLMQVMGGIDPNLLLAGFAATALTALAVGGISIMASVISRKPRDAISLTYLTLIVYIVASSLSWYLLLPGLGIASFPSMGGWSSPVEVQDLVRWLNAGNIFSLLFRTAFSVASGMHLEDVIPDMLRGYALFCGGVLVVCAIYSVLRLRPIALRENVVPQAGRVERELGLKRRPPIGNHPMLWKEVYAEPGPRTTWLTRIVGGLLLIITFLPPALILADYFFNIFSSGMQGNHASMASAMHIWVRVIGALIASLLLLSVAVRASSAVSSERDRQTMDNLLTTPLTVAQILLGKGLGSILHLRLAAIWLGLIYFLGFVTGAMNPLSVILIAIAWFVYAATLSCVGLWYSVVSPTTMRATMWTLLCSIGMGIGHWLVWMCCGPFFGFVLRGEGNVAEAIMKLQTGCTPPLAIGWLLPFMDGGNTGNIDQKQAWEVPMALFGLLIWGGTGCLIWSATLTEFSRRTGRGVLSGSRPGPFPERLRDSDEEKSAPGNS